MSTDKTMQPRDLVLAVIGECGGRDEFGRTSLQKVAYLASIVLGVDLGHHAYYYGPYSTRVEADAEALVMGGLVTETVEPLGYNARGFAVNRYNYVITDAGQERIGRVADVYPDQMARLREFVTQVIDVIGSLDQNTLSAAAKTLYLAREQGKPVTFGEVKALATDAGWQLSTAKIEKVTDILSDLGLVEVLGR